MASAGGAVGEADLPAELLESILRRLLDARELLRVSRVSRRWRAACLRIAACPRAGDEDAAAGGGLYLHVSGRRDPAVQRERPGEPTGLERALVQLQGLRELVVQHVDAKFDARAAALALGDGLRTLVFEGCPGGCFAKLAERAGALAEAALRNGALERLALKRLDSLASSEVAAMLTGAAALTSLDLSHNEAVRDDLFPALAAHCPALASLRLQGCRRLRGRGLADVAAACPRLARLDLGLEWVRVMDPALEALERCLAPVLEELRVALAVSPESLSRLPRFTRLAALSFSCDAAPEPLLASLLRSCPRLRRLRVDSAFGLPAETAARLAPLMTALTDVGLSTQASLPAVGPAPPPAPPPLETLSLHCPALRKLAVYSDSVTNVCVLRSAPRWGELRTLRLCSRHLTGPSLLHISRHCTSLRTLAIANAAVSDSECAAAFAPGQPWTASLTRVDLSGTGAGDGALGALARSVGPRLRGLALYDTRVSDGGVSTWARGGSLAGLESANLSRTGLRDAGLAALLDACPRLWRLYAFECRYLGPALARARASLPVVIT